MREWKTIKDFEEILFEEYNGIAKITINRERYRNAFTPKTTLTSVRPLSRDAAHPCSSVDRSGRQSVLFGR